MDDIVTALDTNLEHGLTRDEAHRRSQRHGPNALTAHRKKSAWRILVDQLENLIVLLLASAAALSFIFGQTLEGAAVCVALAVNVLIGFFTELKAVRSMEALQQMTQITARVLRDGAARDIPAREVVPGDVMLLESGDLVAADMRLVEANRLHANESALTGESLPVPKRVEPVEQEAPLAERPSMLYKGTALQLGSGKAVVVATGMRTELGRIAELAEAAESEEPPLEQRLDKLGERLFWVVIAVAAIVAGVGLNAGMELFLIIETAIALAVAAIPEGLPIVATIALARGMFRMAKRKALINRLSAVETLGTASVLFTDKTGTLTENAMTFTTCAIHCPRACAQVQLDDIADDKDAANAETATLTRQVVETAALCVNASLPAPDREDDAQAVGDPMEIALLHAARRFGMERPAMLERLPEVREVAFDNTTKMMATIHDTQHAAQDEPLPPAHHKGRHLFAVKGAPEAVIQAADFTMGPDGVESLDEEGREAWRTANTELAADGLRVIAVAARYDDDPQAEPYRGLTLLALVGLMDPPRKEVYQAIAALEDQGVEIVMVTGDQPATAMAVGKALGLVDEDHADTLLVQSREIAPPEELDDAGRRHLLQARIFTRVTPEQKLDLVALYQQDGSVCAMTGDGVNDAPALRKADIGVAMGKRGSQVAKEAADVVLQDDSLATVAMAVKQGRIIFENIRKFIIYLLSGNIGGIVIVSAAILAAAPLPLLPLQILYINMIHDIFPALALGMGAHGDPSVIARPRSSDEPIVTRQHWVAILGYGLLLAGAVLLAFFLSLNRYGLSDDGAATVAFLTLAFARTWHVFNMREADSHVVFNPITLNPYVWGAMAICLVMLMAAIFIPGLATVLRVVPPTPTMWGLILGCSVIPLVAGQAVKAALWAMGKARKERSARERAVA